MRSMQQQYVCLEQTSSDLILFNPLRLSSSCSHKQRKVLFEREKSLQFSVCSARSQKQFENVKFLNAFHTERLKRTEKKSNKTGGEYFALRMKMF